MGISGEKRTARKSSIGDFTIVRIDSQLFRDNFLSHCKDGYLVGLLKFTCHVSNTSWAPYYNGKVALGGYPYIPMIVFSFLTEFHF